MTGYKNYNRSQALAEEAGKHTDTRHTDHTDQAIARAKVAAIGSQALATLALVDAIDRFKDSFNRKVMS